MTGPTSPPFLLIDRPANTAMVNAIYTDLLGIINNLPAGGGIPGWYNLADYGAVPDFSMGRTGSIGIGSSDLIVTDSSFLKAGNSIVIEGLAGVHVIDHIAVNHVFLTAPVGGTVTDAPVYTDNHAAFLACLTAMRADLSSETSNHFKTATMVANGAFFLSQGITIAQTVVIRGVGQSESPPLGATRSAPGTMFVFPGNVDGFTFQSEATPPTGKNSLLQNLTIWCNNDRGGLPPNGFTGHGVRLNSLANLSYVTIKNFAGHAVFLDAGSGGSTLFKCITEACGGDGIHASGSGANTSLIDGCDSIGNYGYGVNDQTTGNTYVMVHCEQNQGGVGVAGSEYTNANVSGACLFVGCYAGGSSNKIHFPAMILGGQLSGPGQNIFVPAPGSSIAMTLGAGNQIVGHELVFNNSLGAETIQTQFGNATTPQVALSFATLSHPDFYSIVYDSASAQWQFSNTSFSTGRTPIWLPTSTSQCRWLAPSFAQGFFIGRPSTKGTPAASRNLLAVTTGIFVPGSPPPASGTYELGDQVWNQTPAVIGGVDGWYCTGAGTQGTLNSGLTTGDITINTAALTVSSTVDLVLYQYLTIAGVTGNFQVLDIAGSVITLDHNADATVAGAAVAFSPATFRSISASGGVAQFSQPMADADQNISLETVGSFAMIQATGALSGDRHLTFPRPAGDLDSYSRIVRNKTSGGFNVIVQTSAGTTVTLAPGASQMCAFDPNGVDAVA